MEVLFLICALVFVSVWALSDKKEKSVKLDPVLPAETPFIDVDSLVEEAKHLGIAFEMYERNKYCIQMLRQAYPHEEVQRELDFINESNESIKRQSVSGTPATVLKQEFIMLFDNMHLRLNLTREQFKLITGH